MAGEETRKAIAAQPEWLRQVPTDRRLPEGRILPVRRRDPERPMSPPRGTWRLSDTTYGNSAHEIYDVTDPAKPGKLVTIVDGLSGTHKNWWEPSSSKAKTSSERGFAARRS